tara:strand:+ start:4522 stop:5856 length:1335 start_codon:yes stop_codon:yes gene_type:complete
MKNLNTFKQDILVGSSILSKSNNSKFNKIKFMIDNMEDNLAFKEYIKLNKVNEKNEYNNILNKFKNRYINYRNSWVKVLDNKDRNYPLSVDIEIAAICDLACPHCHREYLVTPDKIINEELYKNIVDQAVKIGVPSLKLIWRGEPLLHPKLKDLITYAKKSGILDVIINTNATNLDEKKAKEIIDSGLDTLIYSFDGGTKETYEKMRPGRFKKNSFNNVYNNIKNFSIVKKNNNSKFPTTKIQMIMTKDTRGEIDAFYNLFNDYVDDVTVTQYNERGGEVDDLDPKLKLGILDYLKKNNLKSDTPYMVDLDGNVYISKKRKECEQIYQRLMVTYSGKVGMCCHDWGAKHTIGYLSKSAYEEENDISEVKKKIDQKKKGFELLKDAILPKQFNTPKKTVGNLDDIWHGEELKRVRKAHQNGEINSIDICKGCTFKDTYHWEKIKI